MRLLCRPSSIVPVKRLGTNLATNTCAAQVCVPLSIVTSRRDIHMRKHLMLIALLAVMAVGLFPVSSASAQTGTCDTTGTVNGSATPVAGLVGDTITFIGTGFTPGESVSFWFTLPNGVVFGTPSPIPNGVYPAG